MRKIINIICVIMITLIVPTAFAGNQSGTVSSTIAQDSASVSNGQFFVTLNGNYNNTPTCNINHAWTIRADTPGGKAMIALVISAQLTGKTVLFIGSGVCTLWGDREDVAYVTLQ